MGMIYDLLKLPNKEREKFICKVIKKETAEKFENQTEHKTKE